MPSLQPCPTCGLADQVRSVAAEYRAGLTVETVRTRRDDRWRTETREVASNLARALAPAPERHPERIPGALGAVALFGAGFLYFTADSQRDFETSRDRLLAGSSLLDPSAASEADSLQLYSGLALLLAVVLLATALLLRVSTNRALAGRPHAERLWSTAWYCSRCGTAHFPPTAGQGAGPLSLQEFRHRVWTAGGYGHLAERHRA
ncbi:hypothetical protein [Kitasatospora sp. NPDC089509]|uniref:hypothetical protein n=1 Tax=Kitasatospora sp. NPDC089509 TaxID=3364079 RepID=UPI0037F1811D